MNFCKTAFFHRNIILIDSLNFTTKKNYLLINSSKNYESILSKFEK